MNHEVSIYTSRSTIHLYLTLKSVRLYIILLDLYTILAKIFGGFAPKRAITPYLLELITKFSWISSEKIIRTLKQEESLQRMSKRSNIGAYILLLLL